MPRATSVWVGAGKAADRIGLTAERLRQLASDGTLVHPSQPSRAIVRITGAGNREYLWPDLREAYIDWLVRQEVARTVGEPRKPSTSEEAKTRLANAQADKIEHEMAVRRAEYIANAYHLREIEILAGRVATILGTLGSTYRERSIGLTEATVDAFWREVENAVRAELHSAVATTEDADPDPLPDEPDARAA